MLDLTLRGLFRLALRLHGLADRERFGAEMERLFEEDVASARRAGVVRAVRIALRETWDIARAGVRERWSEMELPGEQGRPRRHGMERTKQNVRFAVRSLLRRPGFSVLAVLTIALGTGSTTAIFSVVNGILLRSLPYEEPERLVRVWETRLAQPGGASDGSVSPVVFKDWETGTTSFESMAAWRRISSTLTQMGEPEVVTGARVSPGFFRVFRSEPVLGRSLTAEEDLAQGPLAVVVSHAFWQQRMGGSRDVLERTLELNGMAHSIVGVAPPGFDYPAGAQVWMAVRNNDENCSRDCVYLNAVARLRNGASLSQAREELRVLSERLAAEYPNALTNVVAAADGLQETMVGDVRRALYILLAAVGMVLLIACANVANLLLARGATRGDELAVRVAMGAGRGRILFQLLTESLVLAITGGLAGLGLAVGAVRALRALSPGNIPRLDEIGVDGTAMVFALGLTTVTALLFGLLPALQQSRASVAGVLREAARTTGGRHAAGRAWLLASEVALSLVLLVGAGLLLRSVAAMLRVDPGYRVAGLARIGLSISPPKYTQPEHAVVFFGEVERRLEALPGVTAVTSALTAPFTSNILVTNFARTDQPAPLPGQGATARLRVVGHDYFETMDIALVAGRAFAASDRDGTMAVAVINRRLADRFYAGEDPIGKAVSVGVSMGFAESDPRTIVGVIEDVRTENLVDPPVAELYVPFAQSAPSSISFLIASRDPEQTLSLVRPEIRALDADLPIRQPSTLRDLLLQQTARARFYLALLALFAALAVILAAVGLYGVVSFLVAQRQREIGVRLALGASAGSVIRLVVREGLRPAFFGAALGLGASLAGVRLLTALLYGVAPRDAMTFAGTTALLLAVVLLACLVPALRATRISPTSALKAER